MPAPEQLTFEEVRARAYAVHDGYRRVQQDQAGRPWTVAETVLGFVGDVGDLAKLVMAEQGLRSADTDVRERVEHELSDCLWSVIVLARLLDVDLERAFVRTMRELAAKVAAER
ncbi:MazG-like nucleotide pyrophosphohydrolase family protein [Saccharothrix saharensis]|uniref:MazG-like nucleotide pyrophosphohydrolase family protein n=1 Tax=Saccharothrix saharensis TaxID=571190 RepID=A0A543JIY3_9PSEU|nr:MazG nucleotide pyrophosphohydrolase domain-containing protein [Saccharothrix saharensis]TQM82829.1 MazG-like nucleotide pyrophosphohydrolase family protein [Saccharothrix saharensis]